MINQLKLLGIGLFLISILSCGIFDRTMRREKLFDPIPYFGKKLKFSGAYYTIIPGSYCYYFFYQNGILIKFCTGLNKKYDKKKKFEGYNTVPYGWGVYQIEGNNLKIEQWYSGPTTTKGKYPRVKNWGKFLSDSSFYLIEKRGLPYDETLKNTRKSIYKFQELQNRPDSINCFLPEMANKRDFIDCIKQQRKDHSFR